MVAVMSHARTSTPRDNLPFVDTDKRAVFVGRTGSGKTTVARWFLRRSPGTWIILNTKGDPGFAKMPESISVDTFNVDNIEPYFETHKYIIVNPPHGMNNPEMCDAFIEALHVSYEGIGLYVDELYQVMENGRAGQGIIGWMTRGRALQQPFIGSTQRPAWVSRFVFSEADYYGVLTLNLKTDRKIIYDFVGDETVMRNPPPRYWRWYEIDKDKLTLYGPVPKDS